MTRPSIQEVADKLAAIGSPEQIAHFFETEGIKGYKGEADHCPVANYVRRETGLKDVCAGRSGILVDLLSVDSTHLVDSTPLTERVDFYDRMTGEDSEAYRPISEFIRAFDGSAYPAIEAS